MGIISWIILGLIAGGISKRIVGGGSNSTLMTLALGILGAVVGGWISSAIFGVSLQNFFSLQTWAIALLGGLLVTAIYNRLTGKSGRSK